ncbi:MAG: chorismate mutase [Eubacteriales bacterium]|nr:chorismate mutase [Eubacteriales bacterium]
MFTEERLMIDEIDRKMVKLFEERMEVVSRIGLKKRELGLPALDAEREKAVLDKVCGYLANEAYAPYLRKFYQEIMDLAKDYQEAER